MINEKYSHKDFTGKSLVDIKPEELNDSIIIGSCFYQENVPDCKVFPDGAKGITFIDCNLDNVLLPPESKLQNSSNRRILMQNDLEDWILDEKLKPIVPIEKKLFLELGLSIDSKDIPNEKLDKSIINKKREELLKDSLNLVK